MKIFIASDHAGFTQKDDLIKFIQREKLGEATNLGPHSADSVHYPSFAIEVCQKVLQEKEKEQENDQLRGILICGTGIGMSMVANKFQGIRAALCRTTEEAKLSREHNNANVLCLGSRTTSLEIMKEICQIWLTTPFSFGRHQDRLKMMDDLGQRL